jgi:two-component system, response regulator PdtaR
VALTPELNPEERPACLLLVEDDVLIRALLAGRLRMEGVRIVEAADADEAWTYLEAGGAVDLIFSDVRMAGSMNGLEFARRVRTAHPEVKVVLTSGAMPPEGALEAGSFIRKPYEFPKLVAFLLNALGLTSRDAPK